MGKIIIIILKITKLTIYVNVNCYNIFYCNNQICLRLQLKLKLVFVIIIIIIIIVQWL